MKTTEAGRWEHASCAEMGQSREKSTPETSETSCCTPNTTIENRKKHFLGEVAIQPDVSDVSDVKQLEGDPT